MKIALGTLKDKGDDLAAFLEPRVGTKPSLSGDTMEIEDEGVREGVKPRHVKTYIKRFLYMNGVRKNYRVFVAGKELTVQEIELGEEEEEEKKEKPAKKEEEVKEEEPAEQEPEPEEGQEKPEEKEEEKKEEPEEQASEKPADAEVAEEKPKKAAKKPRTARKKKQAEES